MRTLSVPSMEWKNYSVAPLREFRKSSNCNEQTECALYGFLVLRESRNRIQLSISSLVSI